MNNKILRRRTCSFSQDANHIRSLGRTCSHDITTSHVRRWILDKHSPTSRALGGACISLFVLFPTSSECSSSSVLARTELLPQDLSYMWSPAIKFIWHGPDETRWKQFFIGLPRCIALLVSVLSK